MDHHNPLALRLLGTVTLLAGLSAATSAGPLQQAPAPQGQTLPASTGLPYEQAMDVRRGLPDFTLVRYDLFGTPTVRVDLWCVPGYLIDTTRALEFVDRFCFGDDQHDGEGDRSWRTAFLPQASMPGGTESFNFYDESAGIVMDVRPAVQALSCSLSWGPDVWTFDANFPNYSWFHFTIPDASAVVFAAQARRDRNSNPDLFLDRLNPSTGAFVHIQSSTSGTWMDRVGAVTTNCAFRTYRCRLYTSNGGNLTILGSRFRAN